MARKKSEVTEVTDEIQSIEPTIEETPVTEVVEEKPKRGRKKKVEEPAAVIEDVSTVEEVPEVAESPVEEAAPEVVISEPEVISAPVVEEVKPEPVIEEKPKAPKKAETASPKKSSGMAVTKSAVYVLKVPGDLNSKLGNFPAGTKFEILEEFKGWGKVAEGKWVNINYIERI